MASSIQKANTRFDLPLDSYGARTRQKTKRDEKIGLNQTAAKFHAPVEALNRNGIETDKAKFTKNLQLARQIHEKDLNRLTAKVNALFSKANGTSLWTMPVFYKALAAGGLTIATLALVYKYGNSFPATTGNTQSQQTANAAPTTTASTLANTATTTESLQLPEEAVPGTTLSETPAGSIDNDIANFQPATNTITAATNDIIADMEAFNWQESLCLSNYSFVSNSHFNLQYPANFVHNNTGHPTVSPEQLLKKALPNTTLSETPAGSIDNDIANFQPATNTITAATNDIIADREASNWQESLCLSNYSFVSNSHFNLQYPANFVHNNTGHPTVSSEQLLKKALPNTTLSETPAGSIHNDSATLQTTAWTFIDQKISEPGQFVAFIIAHFTGNNRIEDFIKNNPKISLLTALLLFKNLINTRKNQRITKNIISISGSLIWVLFWLQFGKQIMMWINLKNGAKKNQSELTKK